MSDFHNRLHLRNHYPNCRRTLPRPWPSRRRIYLPPGRAHKPRKRRHIEGWVAPWAGVLWGAGWPPRIPGPRQQGRPAGPPGDCVFGCVGAGYLTSLKPTLPSGLVAIATFISSRLSQAPKAHSSSSYMVWLEGIRSGSMPLSIWPRVMVPSSSQW